MGMINPTERLKFKKFRQTYKSEEDPDVSLPVIGLQHYFPNVTTQTITVDLFKANRHYQHPPQRQLPKMEFDQLMSEITINGKLIRLNRTTYLKLHELCSTHNHHTWYLHARNRVDKPIQTSTMGPSDERNG